MAINHRYNATLRNLEYRLRAFRDYLPSMLGEIIMDNEEAIVNTIRNTQLYRRGINGRGVKIMSYAPYKPRTIKAKIRKGQPYTRVTLRDSGEFHKSMFLVVDDDGFYITSDSKLTPILTKKYGDTIFRLTDENLTKIIRQKIRRELVKRIQKTVAG